MLADLKLSCVWYLCFASRTTPEDSDHWLTKTCRWRNAVRGCLEPWANLFWHQTPPTIHFCLGLHSVMRITLFPPRLELQPVAASAKRQSQKVFVRQWPILAAPTTNPPRRPERCALKQLPFIELRTINAVYLQFTAAVNRWCVYE